MTEGDCSKNKTRNFGEGFEHVKSIVIDGKIIVNSGYTYSEQDELIKIPILNILSAE